MSFHNSPSMNFHFDNIPWSPDNDIWINNPSKLIQSLNIFPSSNFSYQENFNSITRMVILISIILFITKYKYAFNFLLVSIIIILIIYFITTKDMSKSFNKMNTPINITTPSHDSSWSNNMNHITTPSHDSSWSNMNHQYSSHITKLPYPAYDISNSSHMPNLPFPNNTNHALPEYELPNKSSHMHNLPFPTNVNHPSSIGLSESNYETLHTVSPSIHNPNIYDISHPYYHQYYNANVYPHLVNPNLYAQYPNLYLHPNTINVNDGHSNFISKSRTNFDINPNQGLNNVRSQAHAQYTNDILHQRQNAINSLNKEPINMDYGNY
jgi:Family of unknown function (DUF5762)